jgi:hypothetical protein
MSSASEHDEALAPFGLRPGAAPSASPETARFGPVQMAAFVALLAVVVLALLVLPQVLRLSGEPKPIWLTGLSGQVSGTYLSAPGGYYKLYPYPELPGFPRASATVAPTATVVVRARQLVQQDLYRIVAFRSHAAVPVSYRRLDRATLELRPVHRLAPGRYFVQAPADSADGDPLSYYFRVAAAARAAVAPRAAP